jgi:glycosyltransferase involved in cell wall biosynthesis
MKVCIASKVSPTYQGGLGAYQRALIRVLAREPGINVEVIYADELNGMPIQTEAAADFSGTKIRERRWASCFAAGRSRLAGRKLTQGLLEHILSATWEFPKPLHPDVIHFVGTGWDFFGFGLANLARKLNSVLTILPAVHPRSWGDHGIDLRLYKQADVVLCLSEHERDHLERLGLPKAKSTRCRLPPMCRKDGKADRFHEKYKLANRPSVLFLGRRDRGKGYWSLLEAWPRVLKSVPGAVLILAGPGGDEFRKQLHRLPAQSICDLGIPNELEKADALAACDTFCLPSAHESFGIVYVEAWSYAKPVICGPAPASREFVKDGQTGLWSSQDPNELAEKILALLRDEQLRTAMGIAGIKLQKEEFNEQAFLATHLQAFRSQPRISAVNKN